eukprot:scaffold23417_cov78-Cyclotella_meneghiniana.AAC.2
MTNRNQCPLIVPPSGPTTAHCFRLHPNTSLMSSLKQAASIILSKHNTSAFILTAVGSLQDVTIRLANASRFSEEKDDGTNCIKRYKQRFEIVSLTGTLSRDGVHIHISLSDAEGNVIGGHLIDGVVFTTCEVVLGSALGVDFVREVDQDTGYTELVVSQLLSEGNTNERLMKHVGRFATCMLIAGAGFALGKMKSK